MTDVYDILKYRKQNRERNKDKPRVRGRGQNVLPFSPLDIYLMEIGYMPRITDIDADEPLTENMDKYAYNRAVGHTKRDAVRLSGSLADQDNLASLGVIAARWENDPRVSKRIEEYKEEIRVLSGIDQNQIVAMYKEAYQGAMIKGDFKTAESIIEKIALMTGNAVKENNGTKLDEIKRNMDDLKTSGSAQAEIARLRSIMSKDKNKS